MGFKCKVCKEEFETEKAMNVHMKESHPKYRKQLQEQSTGVFPHPTFF